MSDFLTVVAYRSIIPSSFIVRCSYLLSASVVALKISRIILVSWIRPVWIVSPAISRLFSVWVSLIQSLKPTWLDHVIGLFLLYGVQLRVFVLCCIEWSSSTNSREHYFNFSSVHT
ncbi:unnamed protein product [Meloidogyne enterolobii]|uniref:Uncharacterized protein n=1 Tax=Meloidogyne enterolobii TaxID=390850 RepID=A0ACB0YWZ2_MELEN